MNRMQYFFDVLLSGLYNLKAHLLRSLLTVLGILFGVWSVIAMLAINESVAKESQKELARLGSSNLIIESVKPLDGGGKAPQNNEIKPFEYGLTNNDISRFRESVPGMERVIITHETNRQVWSRKSELAASVIGTGLEYFQMGNLALASKESRFLCELDTVNMRNVCVLTLELSRELFATEDPLGKILSIHKPGGHESFEVVGVVKPQNGSVGEKSIFIPLSTYFQRLGAYNFIMAQGSFSGEKVEVTKVILKMEEDSDTLRAAPIVRQLLKRYHTQKDYKLIVPLELMAQKAKQSRLWNIMFFSIASVSLLVGGIGIMNIMLASVTERTREIGIRRALGAKQRDIVFQFLLESISLTMVGGLLGVFIGAIAVPWAVSILLEMEVTTTITTLAVPFSMAFLTGVCSGLYPAIRAAQLDPIRALRNE